MPEALDPEYGAKLRAFRERFAATEPSRVVVMVGSSLTIDGFSPAVIEERLAAAGQPALVHNFGVHGGGPLTELLVTRRLLRDGVRPDLALVEVTPAFLAGRAPMHEAERYAAARLWGHEVEVVERYLPGTEGLRQEWWLARLAPWHGCRDNLLGRWYPRFMPAEKQLEGFTRFDKTGWYGLPILSGEAKERARGVVRQTFVDVFRDYTVQGRPRLALEETLDLYRQHEIAVVLVVMPESGEFREMYAGQAWDEAGAYIAEMAMERGLPLIDAREWMDDEGFGDTLHLHGLAAGEFSRRLADHLPGQERLASPGGALVR